VTAKCDRCASAFHPTNRGCYGCSDPGLITGASDDDPSGIGTYSQAGAQFGFAISWTMLFSYPLMVAIQQISARIGRISGKGIAEHGDRPSREPGVIFALQLGTNTAAHRLIANLASCSSTSLQPRILSSPRAGRAK
jgi:hypothetical protein